MPFDFGFGILPFLRFFPNAILHTLCPPIITICTSECREDKFACCIFKCCYGSKNRNHSFRLLNIFAINFIKVKFFCQFLGKEGFFSGIFFVASFIKGFCCQYSSKCKRV